MSSAVVGSAARADPAALRPRRLPPPRGWSNTSWSFESPFLGGIASSEDPLTPTCGRPEPSSPSAVGVSPPEVCEARPQEARELHQPSRRRDRSRSQPPLNSLPPERPAARHGTQTTSASRSRSQRRPRPTSDRPVKIAAAAQRLRGRLVSTDAGGALRDCTCLPGWTPRPQALSRIIFSTLPERMR